MANATKRLLSIAVMVLLIAALCTVGIVMASEPGEEPVCYKHGDVNADGTVDAKDAIYTLYSSIFGEEEYPVSQDCEFDNVEGLDRGDAIYLLYASIEEFKEDYPLKGSIHSYYDPTWAWSADDTAATVTFKCGCGQEHQEAAVVSSNVKSAATCTVAGSAELTAKVTFEDEEYTITKTVVVPATGEHDLDAVPDCTTSAQCKNCDYAVTAPGHKMVLQENGSTPATCMAPGVDHYECENDGCTYYEDVALEQLKHTLAYLEGMDRADENVKCQYVKQYKCTVPACGAVVDGTAEADTYIKHNYGKLEIKEATCVATGLKTYSCTGCGAVKETDEEKDVIPVNENHNWIEDAAGSYHCDNATCTATKVEAVDGKVAASELSEDTRLALDGNISMSMDTTALDVLDTERELKINIGTVELDEITGLDDEKKEQIGENTVYDISMVYADNENEKVANFGEGKVTVSLPYTLSEGEDIDSIDVWFIDDNGVATQVYGTYCNGFVTFETSHFSYYTVTRLTAEERCQRYGHIEIQQDKAATCTEEGYSMKACQRCGQVTEKTIYETIRHKYDSVTKAATCTTTGSVTETCQNAGCGHTVTKVIPALGHNMVTDEKQSVAADCKAAGKVVKVCSRNCGHTTEEATAQLTHNYKLSQEKSVAATCSAGGYEVHVCALCGDEVTKNETAPKGHSYAAKAENWTWSKDYLTATVKLVCENDETHTKTLNAVVTQDADKSENATCLGAGAAVYNAAVSFNNIVYTATKEVVVAAPGHQPASAWETSSTQHYHVCKVCGEKVDPDSHSWDEGTVTKAPTCVESGIKAVTCTVCGYDKEQTIAATGEHSYVNGVCSACGFAENACRHYKTYATPVDLSAYNICEGIEVVSYSCDCGENQYTEIKEVGCTFGDWDMTQTKDEYGLDITTHTSTCTKCGLVMKDVSYSEVNTEECLRIYINSSELFVDGKCIARSENTVHQVSHPGIKLVETVDLEKYGLCSEVLQVKTCHCGKYTQYVSAENCNWQYDPENSNNQQYRYTCSECGAVRITTWEYKQDEDSCAGMEYDTATYYVDGKQVYTYTNTYEYTEHDYEVKGYEMFGEKCTDGILIKIVCSACGDSDEDYVDYHATVNRVTTDLSSYDVCAETVVQATCLCDEQYKESYLVNTDDTYCQFYWNYDETTGTEIATCMNCGLVKTMTTTYGDKDEDCYCLANSTVTYKDKNGNLIATGYTRSEERKHDMKREYILLGESCEDGIKIREYCADCGMEDTWTETGHMTVALRSYDLSAFDSCYTGVTVYGCPCGREAWLSWEGTSCCWEGGGSPDLQSHRCATCGLTMIETMTSAEGEDACHTQYTTVFELSKEGVDTLKFSYSRINETHDSIYTLTLQEGAVDCSGGYTVKEVCQTCGHTEQWGPMYGHQAYAIAREEVSGDKMCGTVTLWTVSCACGQEGWKRIEWTDGECNFQNGKYSEELGGWVYTCDVCGATRETAGTDTRVEGTTCDFTRTQKQTYKDQDGNVLFFVENTSTYESHDFVATFDMQGTTCAEGYYVTRTCQKCGYQTKSDYLYTECENFVLSKKVFHDGTGICGEIALYKNGCPCGAESSVYISSNCRWEYVGHDSQAEASVYKCPACGVMRTGGEETVRRPGSCVADVTMKYTYTLNDAVIGQVEETFTRKQHQMVTVYSLLGERCEDGWTMHRKCVYCDHAETYAGTYYEHETNTTAYYDLTMYGMCGGNIGQSSCACGRKSYWFFTDSDCQWTYTGNKDAETGLEENYCATCETYRYTGDDGAIDTDTCLYTGTYHAKFVRGDEVLLYVSGPVSEERHEYKFVGAALDVPGGTCEDGYTVTEQCENCQKTRTEWNNGHSHYTLKTVDLEAFGSSCGGEIRQYGCVCGEYLQVSWNLDCSWCYGSVGEGDSQNGSSLEERICSNCDLVLIEDRKWAMTGEGCAAHTEGAVTVRLGTSEEVLPISYDHESHSYGDYEYTLVTPGTTCEEGINCTRTCTVCNYTETGMGYGHSTHKVETIDLAQCGAVCGSSLIHYSCACGENQRYDFASDNKCDLDQVGTEHWIDGVVEETWQYSTDGHRYIDSTAYTFTCAVTDPACSLKLRMAEYWLVEECVATEYQTWQYYDAAAGQWVEIDTVETGERCAIHTYTQTAVNETQTDGTKVEGTKLSCADCGSYYNSLKYTYTDNTWKSEVVAEDTTGAGNYKYMTSVNEYTYIYANNCFITSSRQEHTYQNGNPYWSQTVYTYDFTNGCTRVSTYTSIYGANDPVKEDAHVISYSTTTVKYPTCTQYGVYQWQEYCTICEKVVDSGTGKYTPNNHSWSWDDTLGTYVCNTCKLENSNAASGAIALEDMTETYGGGTNYVVGYWNREEIAFIPALSVVLENTNGDDNVVDLTFNNFTYMTAENDGITALSFSMAEAQALAAAAAGDSDSYAIRLTFVPVNGVDELDYAITFDSQSVQ